MHASCPQFAAFKMPLAFSTYVKVMMYWQTSAPPCHLSRTSLSLLLAFSVFPVNGSYDLKWIISPNISQNISHQFGICSAEKKRKANEEKFKQGIYFSHLIKSRGRLEQLPCDGPGDAGSVSSFSIFIGSGFILLLVASWSKMARWLYF